MAQNAFSRKNVDCFIDQILIKPSITKGLKPSQSNYHNSSYEPMSSWCKK